MRAKQRRNRNRNRKKMKVKTVSKCLNIFDETIIKDHHSISNLESIQRYFLESEHEYYQKYG